MHPRYVAAMLTSYRSHNNMRKRTEGLIKVIVIERVEMAQTGKFVNWYNETLSGNETEVEMSSHAIYPF